MTRPYVSPALALLFVLFAPSLFSQDNFQPSFNPQPWLALAGRYETLEPCSDQAAIARLGGRYGLVDPAGRLLLPLEYDDIFRQNDSVLLLRRAGRMGAVTVTGAWIAPAEFAEVKCFPLGGTLLACRRDSLFALFDGAGRQQTPFRFLDVREIAGNRAVAQTTDPDRWGGFDLQGQALTPERYHDLRPQPGGFWQAGLFGQYALLGPDGRERSAFLYRNVAGLPSGNYLAASYDEGLLYLHDPTGKRLRNLPSGFAYLLTADRAGWWLEYSEGKNIFMFWAGDTVALPGRWVYARALPGAPVHWLQLAVSTGEYEEEAYGWMDTRTGAYMLPRFQQVLFQKNSILAADYDLTYRYDHDGQLLQTWPFATQLRPYAAAWVISDNQGKQGLCDTALNIVLPMQPGSLEALPWEGFQFDGDPIRTIFNHQGQRMAGEPVNCFLQRAPYGLRLVFLEKNADPEEKLHRLFLPLEDYSRPALHRPFQNYLGKNCGFYWGKENGLWGLFSASGKTLLPPTYHQVLPVGQQGSVAAVRSGTQAWLLNTELKPAFAFEADSLINCQGGYLIYRSGGRSFVKNITTGAWLPLAQELFRTYAPGGLIALVDGAGIRLYGPDLKPVLPGLLDGFPELHISSIPFLNAAKNDRQGLLAPDGAVALPFEYDAIGNVSESVGSPEFRLEKGGKRGFYDCRDGRLLPARYDQFYWMDTTGFLVVDSAGAQAVFNPALKRLTAFDLAGAEPFGANLFLIRRNDGRSGLIDRAGAEVYPVALENTELSEGLLAGRLNGRAGMLGPDGRVLVPFEYESVYANSWGWVEARDANGRNYFFSRSGRQFGDLPVDTYEALSDSTLYLKLSNGNSGILDTAGRELLPFRLRELECYGGRCKMELQGKWGLVDAAGQQVLPCAYDFLSWNYDETPDQPVVYGAAGLYGYADALGKLLTDAEFDYADDFSNGRAAVRRNGKWGFLDRSGKTVIPLKFDYAENFRPDRNETVVALEGRYVLIDTAGRLTRNFPYHSPGTADFFHREIEHETQAGKGSRLVDWAGRVLLEHPKRFWTEKSGLIGYANDSGDDCTRPPYGLMNYAGQPVGAQEYGDLRLDHLGVCYMIPAYRNKLWGFIDGAGQEVIPFRYHGAWNLSQPFQNGKWYGGVNLDGKSWKVDMSGSFVSDKF